MVARDVIAEACNQQADANANANSNLTSAEPPDLPDVIMSSSNAVADVDATVTTSAMNTNLVNNFLASQGNYVYDNSHDDNTYHDVVNAESQTTEKGSPELMTSNNYQLTPDQYLIDVDSFAMQLSLTSGIDNSREMQIKQTTFPGEDEHLLGNHSGASAVSDGSADHVEAISMTETLSTHSCHYYSSDDYTDSVGSADSKKFLLPCKDAQDCESEHKDGNHSIEFEKILENLMIPGTDFTIDVLDSHKYADIVSVEVSEQNLLPECDPFDAPPEEFRSRSNTMLGLLGQTQGDLGSTVQLACQKALMYLKDETVGSSVFLPGSCRDISKSHKDFTQFSKDPENKIIVDSNKHTRNLIAISICLTLSSMAFGSIRNLQSSINREGGVGMSSLAACFSSFVIGSVFSPFLVQNFQPRKCLIISLFPQLVWVASNIYPVMWLMIPASVLMGAAIAMMWNALSTYVTFLAKGYSEKRKEDFEHTLSRYFGIFGLTFQSHIIAGNLIASLVLMYANQPLGSPTGGLAMMNITNSSNQNIEQYINIDQSNSSYAVIAESVISNRSNLFPLPNSTSKDMTSHPSSHYHLCGSRYCHDYVIDDEGMHVSDSTKYLLYGIYIGCLLIAILIAFWLLEPLNEKLFSSRIASFSLVGEHLKSLGKFFVLRKFLFLIPLLFYSNMQSGFLTAEVTTAFISCPLGVYMVGFTMICFGVCSCISSFLSGWLNRFLGRISLIVTVPSPHTLAMVI
ncbi:uncharacterized protein LOC121388810 isoform X2 [Gigantopelta aegis]|uniref:uncharacterized protein LOC121388810 isoform X2 n=1 Tax=Gigantopelta aegis TaxID=1735272 RepID=UPI001B889843|nr:uncharacterized protein LOC121388810 isoform X2 [Gigantopelta aegis]